RRLESRSATGGVATSGRGALNPNAVGSASRSSALLKSLKSAPPNPANISPALRGTSFGDSLRQPKGPPSLNANIDLLKNSARVSPNSPNAMYDVVLTDRSGEVTHHTYQNLKDANEFADWYR